MKNFENQLIKVFNDSPLPFEAKRYVLLTVFRQVEDLYNTALAQNNASETEDKNAVQQSV